MTAIHRQHITSVVGATDRNDCALASPPHKQSTPPNAPFPRVTKLVREHELNEDAVNDLADGISTRQTTNPLDMAFGMQCVIEKLLNFTSSPPDYKKRKMDLYRDMTVHLLEAMPSLQP